MADMSDLEAAINTLNDNIARLVEGRSPGTDTAEVRERPVGERKDPVETQKELQHLQEKLDAENKILKSKEDGWKILQLKQKIEQKTLQLRYDEVELSKEEYEVEKRSLDNLQKKNIAQKQQNELLFDQSKKIGAMLKMGQHPIFNVNNFIKLGKAMKTAFSSAKGFFSMLGGGLLGLLIAFIDAIINLIFAIDKMESSIKKTTGATQAYAREVTNAWEANRKFVPEMKDFEASFNAAYGTITDYTKKGMAPYRQEMLGTMAILTKFGVAQKDSAQAMQNAMKIFGETGKEAAHSAREMTAFARDLGVPAGNLMSQFNTMAPQLAKLGQAGEKAFKDLARTAKATGMEMNKLLQITDKFDTFEGAAEQAGKLNAALGVNAVNAMDLMTETDPTKRFEMIRDAIMDTGLSFDDMSYYQRKFYTDALGLGDVADLAKMMSGDMSDLDGGIMKTSAEYANMADEARRNMDLQERFKAALMDLVPALTPMVDKLREMMDQWEQGDGPIHKFIHKDVPKFIAEIKKIPITLDDVIASAQILLGIWAGVRLGMMVATPLIWAYTTAQKIKTAADISNTAAQGPLSTGLALTWKQLLAVGGAIALIGAGVGMAAYGLSFFVESFKGISIGEFIAASIAMIGFAFAVKALAITLLTTAPSLLIGSSALWAVGGAIALIGLGVGLAAGGMAMMLKELKADKAVALLALAAGFVALSWSLTTLSVSLWAIALASVGIWALKSVFGMIEKSATKVGPMLGPYATMLAALADIEGTGLSAFAASLENVGTTLRLLPVDQMDKLKDLMNSAEAVQLSAAAVGFNVKDPGSFKAEISGTRQGSSQPDQQQAPANYTIPVTLQVGEDEFGSAVFTVIGQYVKESALNS